jgi:hypothetical protein
MRRAAISLWVGCLAVLAGCSGKLLDDGTPEHPGEDGGVAGVAPDAAATTQGGCDLAGGWALKMAIAVSWNGSGALLGGTGEVDLWALIDAAPGTDSLTVTLRPCGAALPDFSSILGETYGLAFPSDLFDHAPPYLPATSTTITLTGTSAASFAFPVEATVLGLQMANPESDPWPASSSSVLQVDMDRDGMPGVTALAKTGASYKSLPVAAALPSPRAEALYMALRSVASIANPFASCTRANGAATVTALDSHVLGCRLVGGGACSSSEAAFADANRTAFTVASATFQAAKLPGSGSCPDVRSAVP